MLRFTPKYMCILISTINVHFKEEKLPLVINDILNMGVIFYCIKINDEVERKKGNCKKHDLDGQYLVTKIYTVHFKDIAILSFLLKNLYRYFICIQNISHYKKNLTLFVYILNICVCHISCSDRTRADERIKF